MGSAAVEGANAVRLYSYVGPEQIRQRSVGQDGLRIETASALVAWLRSQTPNPDGLVPVTFVVDQAGQLRVADRRSEHVACAGGGPVRSAGELFLGACGTVEEASNQSTGYCPEPESWAAVAVVLDRLGIAHPGRFTHGIAFRRCEKCHQTNIVKDGWFVCGCGAELPEEWNFDDGPQDNQG